jgi:hypothetical protein
MTNSQFLPIESIKTIDAEQATHGTFAYLPHLGLFALFAVDETERLFIEFGDNKTMPIDRVHDDMGTAIVIEDWRLEVDLGSAREVRLQHLTPGDAFTSDLGAGIVGTRMAARAYAAGVIAAGKIDKTSGNSWRGAFSNWRIVTGPIERPTMLVSSPPAKEGERAE